MQNLYAKANDDPRKAVASRGLREGSINRGDKYLHCNYMKRFYGMHMDLMCKKGIYPYEWVDSF